MRGVACSRAFLLRTVALCVVLLALFVFNFYLIDSPDPSLGSTAGVGPRRSLLSFTGEAGRPDGMQAFVNFLLQPFESSCKRPRMLGSEPTSWWVCEDAFLAAASAPQPPSPNCLAYAVGVGSSSHFEEHLIRHKKCEVYSFDPNPDAAARIVPGVRLHPIALGAKSAVTIAGRSTTLCDAVSAFGHANRFLDVLKIDCQGCEWPTLEKFFIGCAALRPARIGQLLVDFHFADTGPAEDDSRRVFLIFSSLSTHGFAPFFKIVLPHRTEPPTWPNSVAAARLAKPIHTSTLGFQVGFVNMRAER